MKKWCILGRGIKAKSHKPSGALIRATYIWKSLWRCRDYAVARSAIFSWKHNEKVGTSTANTQLYSVFGKAPFT
jgi:hypothetical protein